MATTNVYGTGEWQGNVLTTGLSGAFRYVNVWEANFNESTGNTVIKYNIGTWVDYGNFYGSTFQSWGTFGEESYAVYDASGNAYGWHQGTATVAYNGSKRFHEYCGYNSTSSGELSSELDITWKPTLPTYAVTYSKNTTDTVQNMPSSQTKTWGTALNLRSNTPLRAGYTFLGWSTSSSATSATYSAGGTYTANKAATLYAVWKINTYTITYNANGHGNNPSSQTKTHGTPITLRGAMSTVNNYVFKEWNTNSSGTGTSYAAGASYSTNDDLSLWAIWRSPYTITYNANGGSGAPGSSTKAYGASVSLSSTKPIRDGYTFKGWATTQARANAGTVDYASGASYNGNANLSLWAAWTRITYTVTYKPNGGAESQFTATKEHGVSLTLASSGFTRTNYTLTKWNTSADGGGTSYALGYSYTKNAALTLYAIWDKNDAPAPTNFAVTRNSNTKATLTWTRPSGADTTWEKVYVYRSVDGGSYTSLANMAGTATSYVDETTTSNHSYTYRIRAYNSGNGGQYSSYATSSTIYNTPSAPTSITASRVGSAGTGVVLTLTNPALTATGFDVQCSTDGSTWTTDGMTVSSSSGTPVTSVSITMASGGSYYFRVRNKRTSPTALYSAWTASNLVVTIVPPNPPTLVAPTSGGVVQYGSTSSTTVDFQWQHNTVDGSGQSAAQLRYSTNGGTSWIATATVTTAETYTLTYAFAVNATVTWQVRTKGAADDYGAWSSPSTFSVYKKPTLIVGEPSGTIVGMPIHYALTYSDDSGSFASGKLTIKRNGTGVYSENLPAPTGTSIEGDVTTSEFIPADGATYTFEFTAKSNTTLSASESVSRTVDMQAPHVGTLDVTNDGETGYVTVVYGWNGGDGGQPVDHATLYRVVDGARVELASSATNGASCLDMYAPLNTDYSYLVITTGTNLAVNTYEKAARLNSGWWFVYWNGKIAKAKWNPNGSKSVSRPQQELVDYIGRKYPVSYDGTAVREEGTTEFQIIDREYAKAFYEMVAERGSGVYKSGDGEVFHANFKNIGTSSTHHRNQPYGTLTLPYTRIDGDVL